MYNVSNNEVSLKNMSLTSVSLCLVVAVLLLEGFQSVPPVASENSKERGISMSLIITSTAFSNNEPIPKSYTCDSENISPPLSWSGLPEGTKSLVLIMDDPDAPDPKAPKMTWVHWLLYNISPATTGLSENIAINDLPTGTKQGVNDWKRTGYGGPCPPIGRHRYFHKLYALDTLLPDLGKPTKTQLEAAMQGKIIGQAELVGTYQRSR